MKYLTALLAAAVAVSAAELKDYVPECSLKCLSDARASATPCKDDTDLKCFCVLENYRAIYDAAVGCVLLACGNDVATSEVLPAVMSMCEEVSPPTSWIEDGSSSSTAPAGTSATAAASASASPTESSAAAASSSTAADSGAGSLSAGLVGAAVLAALAL